MDETECDHSPCKRTANQQISEIRITIIAPKEGARMGGGGRGGDNFFWNGGMVW